MKKDYYYYCWVIQNLLRISQQMMNSLKKHGLSDTKHQLKYNTPKSGAANYNHNQNTSRMGRKEYPTIGKFELNKKSQMQCNESNSDLVLDKIIQLIERKQRQGCQLKEHNNNPLRYICFEDNCQNRNGCSYCFLENHKLHTKIQAKVCLKDLYELRNNVQKSRGKSKQQLYKKKEQFMNKIQTQINTIRQQFCSNLQYLNKKIKETIETAFQVKFQIYNSIHSKSEDKYKSKDDSRSEQPTFATQEDISLDDIIQKFKQKPKHQYDLTPTKVTKRSFQSTRNYHPQTNNQNVALTKLDEHSLLVKLSKLNLTYVEQYLRHQSIQAKQFLQCLKVFQSYYAELNSSLGQFFSAFKRAIPSPKIYNINLTQPEILAKFHSLKP